MHLGVKQAQLEHVLRKVERDLVKARDLGEALEEAIGRRELHVKVQLHQNLQLHLKNLLFRELVLADVHEVLQQRWINFLVLGSDQHSGHSDELHLTVADLSACKEPVDDVASEEQRFRKQFEIVLHLNEPVDEGGADGLVDLCLAIHIQIINRPFVFFLDHAFENVAAELTHVEHGVERLTIATRKSAEDLALAPLLEHLHLLFDGDLLELRLLLGGCLEGSQMGLVGRAQHGTLPGHRVRSRQLRVTTLLEIEHLRFR